MLSLEDLDVRIGNKQVVAGLSLTIHPGERWALLGINGVGKTTLLHTLAGLRAPRSGRICVTTGLEVGSGSTALTSLPARERARCIGLMSQDDDFAAETQVMDAVLLGRLPHMHWWRGESANDSAIARSALRRVGLDESFDSRIAFTLSGGERRRVALATLLAQSAPLLILDEPTSHLDLHQQVALLDLLARLDGHTLIMSLHDVNLAVRYCTHALLLFGDGQCCGGPISEMLHAPVLSRLYHHTIAALDGPDGPLYFPA